MRLLGIDYGQRKIGLAVGDIDSKLAEPLSVIYFKSVEEILNKLGKLVRTEQVERIVLGISEGKMAQETVNFGKKLEEKTKISVIFCDETLTTKTAQKLAIDANIGRKRRKDMEDAYSACLILQEYLDFLDASKNN
ncbi:hypothetical protein A2159_03625 [Candidatus Woesebacteria bacterium RBG_13_34_9]|uniref:Putative pre-16S rRNA nuclease n=1 Tax=Candidatus Woesebacteria bacterium RBG_13_34_9 TaxID=1802477 RepID=A0A1F7X2F9_9BACT|nr:MAG: hypothetical protein A2159_03625 [Candidatus Woesebacteria bacterium RBG_13_34_9]